MTDAQQSLIDQLTGVLAADPRVRSVWLHGSLGRGIGDPWSDVDLAIEVAEPDRATCLADYACGRTGLPDLAMARPIFGRILTAVTPDWARFDLMFVTGEELARLDRAALRPLLGDPGSQPSPLAPVAEAGAPARLAALVEEFLRVLGLTPVGVGRGEWLVMQHGTELLRRMLVDLMLEENGFGSPEVRGGVKRLNPFLSETQRATLERLEPPLARPEALLAATVELARLFLARARPLAERLGTPWPEAFETATRRHLRTALGLEI